MGLDYEFTYEIDDFDSLPQDEGDNCKPTYTLTIAYDFCGIYGDPEGYRVTAIEDENGKPIAPDSALFAAIVAELYSKECAQSFEDTLSDHIEENYGPFRDVNADHSADYRAWAR